MTSHLSTDVGASSRLRLATRYSLLSNWSFQAPFGVIGAMVELIGRGSPVAPPSLSCRNSSGSFATCYDTPRFFYLGKLNQSSNLRWLSIWRAGNLKRVAHNRRRSTWPWSQFFVQRARILGSHRQTLCLVRSPVLVAIANNGLKVGRYSAGSPRATMLFGKTSTNFMSRVRFEPITVLTARRCLPADRRPHGGVRGRCLFGSDLIRKCGL
jgi:hypothetical protein